jgi:hypothetical protein
MSEKIGSTRSREGNWWLSRISGRLDQPVGERAFAVVDVGDNAEISDSF